MERKWEDLTEDERDWVFYWIDEGNSRHDLVKTVCELQTPQELEDILKIREEAED